MNWRPISELPPMKAAENGQSFIVSEWLLLWSPKMSWPRIGVCRQFSGGEPHWESLPGGYASPGPTHWCPITSPAEQQGEETISCIQCNHGHAGADHTGEAIDCHYCDGHGNITAAMHVDLRNRFNEAVGDLMERDARDRGEIPTNQPDLATLPPDADEPISEEWLKEIGWTAITRSTTEIFTLYIQGDGKHLDIDLSIAKDGSVWRLAMSWWRDHFSKWPLPLENRQQLRALLAALGVAK